MATIYSARLTMAHGVGADSLTVPAGFVCVVRDADCFYPGGVGQSAQLENPAGGIFAYFPFPLTVNGILDSWRGRQVFLEGETVTFAATAAMDIQVSGYLLSA